MQTEKVNCLKSYGIFFMADTIELLSRVYIWTSKYQHSIALLHSPHTQGDLVL